MVINLSKNSFYLRAAPSPQSVAIWLTDITSVSVSVTYALFAAE